MSKQKSEQTTQTTTEAVQTPKVIIRKPGGANERQGWVGEVINPDKTRYFVPELFKEELTEQELAMTKIGNCIKAIADATVFAAQKNYRVSEIILLHGVDCIAAWQAYTKAVKERKEARAKSDEGKTTREAKAEAWDKIKGKYNSAVRVASLKMEMLYEDKIAKGEPKKILN